MPVKYIGNALYKKQVGTSPAAPRPVWEPQVLIPVSSVSKIPVEFRISFDNGWTSNAELIPVRGNVSIKGAPLPFPQQQEITSFPWETIQLLDNQIDYYFKLQNDEEVRAEMKDLEEARNGSYQVQNVEAMNFLVQNRKQFRIDSLYLGCSQSLLDYAKSALKAFSYQVEPGNIENIGKTRELSPWNVWYAVGSFDVNQGQEVATNGMRIWTGTEFEVAKPSALSITRESEDFTKAQIVGENVGVTTTNQRQEAIIPKIKFIFDNGVEKYAEIIEYQVEISIGTIELFLDEVQEVKTETQQALEEVADSLTFENSTALQNNNSSNETEAASDNTLTNQFFVETAKQEEAEVSNAVPFRLKNLFSR